MTLDVTRDEAVTVLEALGAAADVVVASPTRRTPVAGFDRDEGRLQWAAPEAIVASITPFGLVGPMRDLRTTPFVSFAMGGGMHWTGHGDGPPLAAPGQLAWDEAGIHAAFGIVSALFGHGRFGGQTLDFAVHDLAASKDFLIERFDVGAINDWGRSVEIGVPPSGRWKCRDGLLGISAHQRHHWEAFLAMLDHPDELSEPSLADPQLRREIFDGLQEVISRLVMDRSRDELFEKGQAAGLPCAPVNDPGDFVRDEQPLARDLFATLVVSGEETGDDPLAVVSLEPADRSAAPGCPEPGPGQPRGVRRRARLHRRAAGHLEAERPCLTVPAVPACSAESVSSASVRSWRATPPPPSWPISGPRWSRSKRGAVPRCFACPPTPSAKRSRSRQAHRTPSCRHR